MARAPKRAAHLAIPDDLAAFLEDVSERIAEGDEATRTPSDDLLQCDVAYGGLTGRKRERFAFTYFASERCRWYFSLTPAQLASIGSMRTLPLFSCRTCECAFATAGAECSCCDVVRPTPRAPDGTGFTVRIAGESFGVNDARELDAILAARINASSRIVVTVVDSTGTRALHAGLAMDGSFCAWCGPDRSPPYATSEGNEEWEGEMPFTHRGENVRVPRRYEIGLPLARAALRAFLDDPTQPPAALAWAPRGHGPFVLV